MRAIHPHPNASGLAPENEEICRAVERMRDAVLSSATDCECRGRLDEALRRFEMLEQARVTQLLLAAADEQRRRIGSLLMLLGDPFQEQFDEPDDSLIAEAGLLLGDISAAAELGSRLLSQARRLSSRHRAAVETPVHSHTEWPVSHTDT
ncbi:hypothetical protein [Sinorhizobium arboris]|uniref:hypothetical protein n=1 Tax=Sinorhizobium arboris TaxID=76745 RepID=UPI0003FA1296|nr:hypothetical protein [Sinorhizobium arboris]